MRLGTMSQVVSERPEPIAPQHGWLLPDGRFIPEHKPAVTSESVSSGHHYPKSHFVIINLDAYPPAVGRRPVNILVDFKQFILDTGF